MCDLQTSEVGLALPVDRTLPASAGPQSSGAPGAVKNYIRKTP